ncbi:MAG: hypothetical protein ACE37F_19595 [Nannocystaceae bacterium]|nr:hypothetical protein [bacterium]
MVRRQVALSLLLLGACGDDLAEAETDGGTGTDSEGSNSTDPTSDAADESGTSGCGPLSLTCPEPLEVECEGPQTAATLQPPVVECSSWSLSDDAPEAYEVGTTEVTYIVQDGGDALDCTTEVTVTDTTEPALTCPKASVLLRTEIGAVAVPGTAVAEDLCDPMPTIAVAPMTLESSGMVTYEAVDASGNASSCQTEYTLVDAFAVPGFRIIAARGEAQDTEVALAWEPPTSLAVDGLRIESAAAEDGPWSEVATVGADEQLYTGTLDEDALFFRVVSTTEHGDGGATTARRAFQVSADAYDVRDVDVPNVPFDTTLYGVVRHPLALDEGPFPLVVVLHGNHGNCRSNPDDPFDYCVTTQDHDCSDPGGVTTPNAEGYVYFLETLAAQGYIAVSISGNAMNCRNDFIFERAELMVEHLRAWSAWNDADAGQTASSFVGRVDMGRVGLVGHSRGGDAASNVPGVLEGNPIPGVDVQSIFAIAPTDFHDVEVPGADFAVLLPGCDLDVAPLVGMNHYDRSIELDDGARRTQVFALGMNHNFFNEQWQISEWDLFGVPNDPFCTPDDDALKLTQTHTLEALLGSWFEQTLMAEGEPEPFMQATSPSPSSFDLWAEQDLEMRWSYSDGSGVMIDDFTAGQAPLVNTLGGANTFTDWFLFEACFELGCDPFFNHVKRVARLLWQLPAEPLASFSLLGYDASGHDALAMRVVSRRSLLNDGLEQNDFIVRLRDEGGNEAEVLLSDAKPLRHLYPHSDPLEVLETFQLRLEWFVEAQPRLDLANLAALEFDMTATGEDGSVIVSDIEFL